MQRRRKFPSGLAAALVGVLALAVATVTDGLVWFSGTGVPPHAASTRTHALLAVAIGAGCLAVLGGVLQRTAEVRVRRRVLLPELVAIGVLLGSLVLRGHPEIPPDGPLIGVQLGALGILAATALLRCRTHRTDGSLRTGPGGSRP
jgi:hypothetical protein